MVDNFTLFNFTQDETVTYICRDVINECKSSGVTVLFDKLNGNIYLGVFIILLLIYISFQIDGINKKLRNLCFLKKEIIKNGK